MIDATIARNITAAQNDAREWHKLAFAIRYRHAPRYYDEISGVPYVSATRQRQDARMAIQALRLGWGAIGDLA